MLSKRRYALVSIVAGAILAGCGSINGGSFTPSSSAEWATQKRPARSYHVLYNFGGRHGASPYSSPIEINGALYGTTSHGGTYDAGTFYKLTISGKETVVRSFFGVRGALPLADFIDVKGTLYGTTELGGTGGGCSGDRCGTVFAI